MNWVVKIYISLSWSNYTCHICHSHLLHWNLGQTFQYGQFSPLQFSTSTCIFAYLHIRNLIFYCTTTTTWIKIATQLIMQSWKLCLRVPEAALIELKWIFYVFFLGGSGGLPPVPPTFVNSVILLGTGSKIKIISGIME